MFENHRPTCPECGGPTRQAFGTSPEYVACRRDGRVFTNDAIDAEQDAQIAAEDRARLERIAAVREVYGNEAGDLVANGWTIDAAIAHVSGSCDRAICSGDHDGRI